MTLSKGTFPTDLKSIPTNRLASNGLLFAKTKVQSPAPWEEKHQLLVYLKGSLTEKDLRLLVNAKNMSQKCALVEKER